VVPQYFDSYSLAPDVVLTTVLFNLDGVAEEMINRGAIGAVSNKNYVFTYKDGVGRLAPLRSHASLLTASNQRRFTAVQAMLENGTLQVPFLGDLGNAKAYDVTTLPAVPSG
jgi:basic membrane protein A and related proteins